MTAAETIRRIRESISYLIFELLCPSQTINNLRLLGSEQKIAKERKRIQKTCFIIHPLSMFRRYWDLSMMILMLLNMFLVPLDIAFFTDTWKSFHLSSDIFCICDIFINFRTAYCYQNYERNFEIDPKLIALHYLKSWFVFDLVSSLPLHYVIAEINGMHENVSLGFKSASRAFKFLKMIKLFQLLKLLRLSRILRGISQYGEAYRLTSNLMRYVKLIFMMIIVAHWNGCLLFLILVLQDFPEGCWVEKYHLRNAPWYTQYSWALFKTLSHMLSIGYGRYPPVLISETIIATFSMITGVTFYAIFIANSIAHMVHGDYSKKHYLPQVKKTEEYLIQKNVPESLNNRVDIYFSHKYSCGRNFDNSSVLSSISRPIRNDLKQHLCRDIINRISFFRNAPPGFVSAVVAIISSDVYLADDVIATEGTKWSDIYIIRDGELIVTSNDVFIEKLSAGNHFGIISVLTGQNAIYTVKALCSCVVSIIPGNAFKTILAAYESVRPILVDDGIRRLHYIRKQIRLPRRDDHKYPTDLPMDQFKDLLNEYIDSSIDYLGQK